MLENFQVRRFRTFNDLQIERLGRVNLIVGQNNVGKTTLLEAIWLYVAGASPEAIWDLLVSREELSPEQEPDSREREVDISSLFHGRLVDATNERSISLGPLGVSNEQIKIRLTWVASTRSSDPGATRFVELKQVSDDVLNAVEGEVFPALIVSRGTQEQFLVRRHSWSRALRRLGTQRPLLAPPFLHANGVDDEAVGRWWDSVALRESENRVIECLNLLTPVERINLVEGSRRYGGRVFHVRLKGQKQPQPLKSLGDGIVRMFQTSLALEFARRKVEDAQLPLPLGDDIYERQIQRNVLLLDEVEVGIHYTAIGEYWRFLFRTAKERNVQVFATTHSWDCIEGFQRAAKEAAEGEGLLIRLERRDDVDKAVVIADNQLAIVTREKIEVR